MALLSDRQDKKAICYSLPNEDECMATIALFCFTVSHVCAHPVPCNIIHQDDDDETIIVDTKRWHCWGIRYILYCKGRKKKKGWKSDAMMGEGFWQSFSFISQTQKKTWGTQTNTEKHLYNLIPYSLVDMKRNSQRNT